MSSNNAFFVTDYITSFTNEDIKEESKGARIIWDKYLEQKQKEVSNKIDQETKDAILSLWEIYQPNDESGRNKLKQELLNFGSQNLAEKISENPVSDMLQQKIKLIGEQNVIKRVPGTTLGSRRTPKRQNPTRSGPLNVHRPLGENSRLEALEEVSGVAMEAFLDPERPKNPMFDIEPITVCLIDKLELELKENSVWR